ncbi:Hsp20 family protein [Flavobacterium alkalisoli]|nr:Hsp20 family protein [Flavobacterium alkalisoli]
MDDENINAKYENGLLHLTIPKKEEAKRKAQVNRHLLTFTY